MVMKLRGERQLEEDGWNAYFENTKHSPPCWLLLKALKFATSRDRALDLGAGALNDTFCLLKEDYGHVTALDIDPMARKVAALFPRERFTYTIASFEDFAFGQGEFDLVNAQFALPFAHPRSWDAVWEKVVGSLRPGGIVTGQFFGDRDSWRDAEDMTFLTRSGAEEALAGMQTLFFDEEESGGKTATGSEKHWHIFHFIARK